MLNEQEIKKLIDNPMKPTDTLKFSCKACGNCCRNRKESIILTGYDVFRIAKELGIEMKEVVIKYTIGYIGNNSKLPVLILKERADGSCSLLRKGKCIVHQNKPLVCAIYPLGRCFLPDEKRFGYFHRIYVVEQLRNILLKNGLTYLMCMSGMRQQVYGQQS